MESAPSLKPRSSRPGPVVSTLLSAGLAACGQDAPSAPAFGFHLVSWDASVTLDEYGRSLRELADAGAREVSIVVYRFVDAPSGRISARSVHGLEPGPSTDNLRAISIEAARIGLEVSFDPFLEIDDPRGIGHRWRGDLSYSGAALDSFFEGYAKYVLEVAEIGRETGAHRLFIGSELKALATKPEAKTHWEQLIAQVRAAAGDEMALSYAANHDSYRQVTFWPVLDEIAVDAYGSLATIGEAAGVGAPSRDTLRVNAARVLDELAAFARMHGKPLVISEWGLVPFDATTARPSDWSPSQDADPLEQTRGYQAFIRAAREMASPPGTVLFWHWGGRGNAASAYAVTADSELARAISASMAP